MNWLGFILGSVLLGIAVIVVLPVLVIIAIPVSAFALAARGIAAAGRLFSSGSDQSQSYSQSENPSQPEAEGFGPTTKRPQVLIVEDDIDVALLIEKAFVDAGCRTKRNDGLNSAHLEMAFGDYDIVVLDWSLGQTLTAREVVSRADRLINLFPDLRAKFAEFQPIVLTESVLGAEKIDLPQCSYFAQFEHWKKPFDLSTIARRSREMALACR